MSAAKRQEFTPFYEDALVRIYNGDYRDYLEALRIASPAMVFADPPYHVGIAYDSYWDKTDDPTEYAAALVSDLCALSPLVVITPGTVNQFDYPRPDAVVCRFDRTQQSPSGVAWMCKWEPVFVYGKTPQRLAWDVVETAAQSERARTPLEHPVPKPIALLHALISKWTQPGELVVDPFLGSGTTARAAKDLGRRCIGVEIDAGYCATAVRRLGQEVLDLAV